MILISFHFLVFEIQSEASEIRIDRKRRPRKYLLRQLINLFHLKVRQLSAANLLLRFPSAFFALFQTATLN